MTSPAAPADPSAPSPAAATAPATTTPAAPTEEKKLSPKELKEQKKAEKAARRAESKTTAPPQRGPPKPQQPKKQQGKKGAEGVVKTIYVTGNEKPSSKIQAVVKETIEIPAETARDRGLVGLLRDLEHDQTGKKKYPVFGIHNAHPDVHAAILTLGMQINKKVLTGSSARCLGFLLAIKRVRQLHFTESCRWLTRRHR